ncbi:MAG: transketolase [Candidatus Micrarchaeota archaeon]
MQFKKVTSEKQLKLIANSLRQDVVKMLCEAKSGHTAGSLGMVDVFTALYFAVANHDPKNPKWDKRDRVVLSNGHICPIWYATLAQCGYFPKKQLMTLRKLGSPLQGHPHYGEVPGVENSGGPLSQGISIAIGMALAARMNNEEHTIYCLTSDGEHDEGQYWEALMFAGNHHLDNLCVVVDRNYIQIDGNTEEINALQPLKEKYQAFKWNVIEVKGNEVSHVVSALQNAGKAKGKPTVIIANNIPGKGVSFIQNRFEWHGKAPNEKEAAIALKELESERKQIQAEKIL